jgi:excisionase family DNA binding protein
MSDLVLILLPGVGTLQLSREVYEASLVPLAATTPNPSPASVGELVTAKMLAITLSLPVSCIYEYAKAGRIPSVRVGKHVRFDASQVLTALRTTGAVTVGRA